MLGSLIYQYQTIKNQQDVIVQMNKDHIDDLKSKEEALSERDSKVDQLTRDYKDAQEQIEMLKEESTLLKNNISAIQTFDYFDELRLAQVGIDDITLISEDLYKHPELIPYEGVLGGTMAFTDIDVINYKWVYAKYEDGHIIGYGLYEYHVDDEAQIVWRLVSGELY